MSELNQALSTIQQQRSRKNSLGDTLRNDLERAAELERDIKTAISLNDKRGLGKLLEEQKALQTRIPTNTEAYHALKLTAFDGLAELFERFGKPQDLIKNWDDHRPITLFPIRLETRFQQNTDGGTELLIRIFPDEASVNQHERTVTKTEVASGKSFWLETWKAVNRDERIAAWEALVKGHGQTRAAWVSKCTKPLNINELEVDLFDYLTDADYQNLGLTATETAAGKTYWRAVWMNKDATNATERQQTAQTNLATTVGISRASTVTELTIPNNWNGLSGSSAQTWFDEKTKYSLESSNIVNDDWRRSSFAEVLPDKFVFIGYQKNNNADPTAMVKIFEETGNPVPDHINMSPDPKGIDNKIEKNATTGVLEFKGDVAWMQDFSAAEAIGLAKRIHLDTQLSTTHIDRLIVVGLNLVDDASHSAVLLEKLFSDHHYAPRGMSFLPQGTPTNNTENAPSDYLRELTAAESYALEMESPTFVEQPITTPFYEKTEGQRTAEALGISPSVFQNIRHADRRELAEAQSMNVAMWNATLGYYMGEMLDPLTNRADIHNTFEFFTRYVSGRGGIPAFRTGRQAYGILPTTQFSKWQWSKPETTGKEGFYTSMSQILHNFEKHWRKLLPEVKHLTGSSSTTMDKDFLNIVALHAQSVSYAERFFWGLQMSRSIFRFYTGNDVPPAQIASWKARADKLVSELGFDIAPAIANKDFWSRTNDLLATLNVDTEPLSETNPVKPFYEDPTQPANNQNYLHWLRTNTVENIKEGVFKNFKGEVVTASPTLLFKLLQYAVLQSYWDTAMKLYEDYKVVNWAARLENQIANVRFATAATDNKEMALAAKSIQRDFTKQEYLEARLADNIPVLAAANNRDMTMQAFLSENSRRFLTRDSNLPLVHAALEKLEKLPTARLERLMAEHIDLCSYRLDGWLGGLMQKRLEYLRYEYRRPIESDETSSFVGKTGSNLRGTYLAAYGWLEDIKPSRVALPSVLKDTLPKEFANETGTIYQSPEKGGFIHAPSLQHATTAALLRNGYLTHANSTDRERLSINLSSERVRKAMFLIEGMQQGQELGALLGYELERSLHDAELDTFIYRFRAAFPFKFIRKTETPTGQSIEVAAVQNVVDGYALLNAEKSGTAYPYGVVGLPVATEPNGIKILSFVDQLRNMLDAVADVNMSESIHQFLQGNHARTNAALKTIQEGQMPNLPDVIQTPRSGNIITNRVVLHLNPAAAGGTTPRSIVEPALNQWLKSVLGDILNNIAVMFSLQKPNEAPVISEFFISSLGLEPIDMIFSIGNQQKDLEKRLSYAIRSSMVGIENAELKILYDRPATTAQYILTEVMPLLNAIEKLVKKARPTHCQDLRLSSESKETKKKYTEIDAKNTGNVDVVELKTRVDNLKLSFETDLLTPLNNFYAAAVTQLKRTDIDDAAKKDFFRNEIMNANWEVIFKQAAFYDVADAFPTAPLGLTNPQVGLRIDADFIQTDEKQKSVEELQKMFSTEFFGTPNNTFTFTFLSNLVSLKLILEKKLKIATEKLAKITPTVSANEQITFLTDTAKALIGSSLTLIPKFNTVNATELQTAFSNKDALWAFKTAQLKTELPDLTPAACQQLITEEWLQGISRVREPMRFVEDLKTVAEMLHEPLQNTAALTLTPLQLPYLGQQYWVALDIPETVLDNEGVSKPLSIDRDYLSLIGLNMPASPIFNQIQCGLLLDEWTELVPNKTENTGVSVNYNQPNSEPAQCLLLAISPTLTGAWTWDNLVGTLNETLDRAKMRAIEPDIIAQKSLFTQLLPAVATVYSNERTNISLDYSQLHFKKQ